MKSTISMINYKDFAVFYVGAMHRYKTKFNPLFWSKWEPFTLQHAIMYTNDGMDGEYYKYEFALRRLSSMTDEEKTDLVLFFEDLNPKFIHDESHFETKHDTLKQLRYDSLTKANEFDMEDLRLPPTAYYRLLPYLLSKHFDVFGLIDDGLCLDIETIKKDL